MSVLEQSRKRIGLGSIVAGGFLVVWGLVAFFLLPASTGTTLAAALSQTAEEGQVIFQQKCQACHTIGSGKLVGPDLQGVLVRRDLDWVKTFVLEPDRVIASGDPIATQLLAENGNIPMPNLGLTEAEVDALLAFLADPAAQPSAPPTAPPVSGAVEAGMDLFTGKKALANGGVSCIGCHTVSGIAAVGGGSLGPDLTQVFQRYGAAGLQSALGTLPFPTMQGIFLDKPLTAQEQADLYAYFEWANGTAPQPTGTRNTWLIIGVGSLGALVLFIGMVFFYPKQHESISDKLRRGAIGERRQS